MHMPHSDVAAFLSGKPAIWVRWNGVLGHLDVALENGKFIFLQATQDDWQKVFKKAVRNIPVILWGSGIQTVIYDQKPPESLLDKGNRWIRIDESAWVETKLSPSEMEPEDEEEEEDEDEDEPEDEEEEAPSIPGFMKMDPHERHAAATKVFDGVFSIGKY